MNVQSRPRVEPLRQESRTADDAPVSVVLCCTAATTSSGLLTKALRRTAGIEVAGVASNGTEADRLVRAVLPDVVLLDLHGAGTAAIDAIRRIRDASPTTRVAILTVSSGHGELYQALRAGATGYINRHSGTAELATALRAVARGHYVIPACLAGGVLHDLENAATVTVSATEREILAGLARGDTHSAIARRLHLSDDAMSRRLEDIYSKLHLADRVAACSQGS